jgi:hypothetical protein
VHEYIVDAYLYAMRSKQGNHPKIEPPKIALGDESTVPSAGVRSPESFIEIEIVIMIVPVVT